MIAPVYVRPLEGTRFRDPETREPLPAAGAWVPRTTFWRRALMRGDVVACDPPRHAPPAPAEPSKD